MITFKNLSYKSKNEELVYQNLNFVLEEGKITSLLGRSGIGKSTLLRALMGLEESEGQIITRHSTHDLKNWKNTPAIFSIMLQLPFLLPWKNILENIALAVNEDLKHEEKRDLAFEALKKVKLEKRAYDFPQILSVGMAQKVAFARSLVSQAPVLLLDEPFSSLDVSSRWNLYEWLTQVVQETNKHCLLVTHDIREALYLSESICVLGSKPASIALEILKEKEWRNESSPVLSIETKIRSIMMNDLSDS